MKRYIPNALTLARFPLSVALAALHLAGLPLWGLVAGSLACVSDYFDGFFARRWKCESEFGKKVDPYADKTICWTLTIAVVSDVGLDPLLLPVIAAIAAYDVGLGIVRYVYRHVSIPTSPFAKRKTTALMVGLLVLYADGLLGQAAGEAAYWLGMTTLWGAMYFALRAMAHYVRQYGWGWLIPHPFNLML